MVGRENDPARNVQLADGSLVPEGAIMTTMRGIAVALEWYRALAAIDLRDLADGRQPQVQPVVDTGSLFLDLKLCHELQDGSLEMHDVTAALVRNAVHINPQDELDFRLTDPRLPFDGFEPRS